MIKIPIVVWWLSFSKNKQSTYFFLILKYGKFEISNKNIKYDKMRKFLTVDDIGDVNNALSEARILKRNPHGFINGTPKSLHVLRGG